MSRNSRRRKRQGRRKKIKKAAANAFSEALDNADLPRPIRLMVENMEQFENLVSAATGPTDAVERMEEEIRENVRRLVEITSSHDAFDVLEHVRLYELRLDPELYRETEHEGSGTVVELVALVLSKRTNREPLDVGDDQDLPDVDEIVGLARGTGRIGSLLPFVRALGDPSADQLTPLALRATGRAISVRNLAYPHMADELLEGLFSPPEIEAACRSILGFTPIEVLQVLEALESLNNAAWIERESRVVAAFDGVDLNIEPEAEQAAQIIGALEGLWGAASAASVFSDDAVSAQSGVNGETVAKVRDALATRMTDDDPESAVIDFFSGVNPFRTRPLLATSDRTSMLVHSGFNMESVRIQAEEALKTDARAWDRYSKHRGTYLEDQALGHLRHVFPTAQVYEGFEYFSPDPDSGDESAPSGYTKLVEGDGLVIVDDVAFVVEAKAKPLSEKANRGVAPRLASELRKIVTEASEQAERLRSLIVQDHGLRLRDGSWLDLASVVEVHTIAVSLDDLSTIATVTSHLVNAGLLEAEELPWTVSLMDLRVVAEVVDRPAELLLYVRRRTDPAATAVYSAVDELDFFLEFLSGGFYVEPDPEVRLRDLPQLGEPSIRDRRRYKKQGRKFLTSRTDALDAWYAYQLGERQSPAPKPVRVGEAGVLQLVDQLRSRAEPGWLAAGAALLDAGASAGREFSRMADDLARQTRQDGKSHSTAVPMASRLADSHLLVWITKGPRESPDEASRDLSGYVSAKKHQLQLARATGMLFDAEAELIATAYDNRPPMPDKRLDEIMGVDRLRPVGDFDSPGKMTRRRAKP